MTQAGTILPKTCSCKCNTDWGGLRCNECKHGACQHGGVLDKSACRCNCLGNWGGKFCGKCTITGKHPWRKLFDPAYKYPGKKCAHGVFDATNCKCICDKNWGGNLCDQCVHPSCGVAGKLDKMYCRCDCVPAWVGDTCRVCVNPLCTRPPVNAASCAWIKSIGCPSIGNRPAQPELKPTPVEPARRL